MSMFASSAVKPRPLKGNWFEEDILREDKVTDFTSSAETDLTWTRTYTHLKTLNADRPLRLSNTWTSLPDTKPTYPLPPVPYALTIDPDRRYLGLAAAPPIPTPPRAPRTSLRYGQKVVLLNSGDGAREACLTFDAWTKVGAQSRLMVCADAPRRALARTVFEIGLFEAGDTESAGRVVTYGDRFCLLTSVAGQEMAVCCPISSINNLPGGGEANQSLVLTSHLWGLASAFTLIPRKPIPKSVHAAPVDVGDTFGLTCLAGNRPVTSHREKTLLSLIGGNMYPAISRQATSSYLQASPMDWSFAIVEGAQP
ncbi:hypothetical protein BC830DRAFT_1095813 [Chytriomyces sp. MP71]|nr:hypothetical protein BC830DRAFT_1095813 [Chytriomyces sp. MP71]